MRRCLGCMREYDEEFELCPYCGYVVDTPVQDKNHLPPGTMLHDRYLLGRVLGQGGFGITYIAWDKPMETAVAIKEYLPNAIAYRSDTNGSISCYSRQAERQFARGLRRLGTECLTIARFNDLESVVNVLGYVEENGTGYIVMELLRGRTLRELLAQKKKLPFAQAVEIMTPVLQTLQAMHEARIIHRDVSPDNIFLCDDGRVKLLDFGAARLMSNETDEKTLSVILKRGYAPIEQYSRNSFQSSCTDVYAASATMYKMLTGVTPPASIDRIAKDELIPPSVFVDIPHKAEKILLHGLEIRPQDRIGTALELAAVGDVYRKKPIDLRRYRFQAREAVVGLLRLFEETESDDEQTDFADAENTAERIPLRRHDASVSASFDDEARQDASVFWEDECQCDDAVKPSWSRQIQAFFMQAFRREITESYAQDAQDEPDAPESAFHFDAGRVFSELREDAPKAAQTPPKRPMHHAAIIRCLLIAVTAVVLLLIVVTVGSCIAQAKDESETASLTQTVNEAPKELALFVRSGEADKTGLK